MIPAHLAGALAGIALGAIISALIAPPPSSFVGKSAYERKPEIEIQN